jgi:hypothetical protein
MLCQCTRPAVAEEQSLTCTPYSAIRPYGHQLTRSRHRHRPVSPRNCESAQNLQVTNLGSHQTMLKRFHLL